MLPYFCTTEGVYDRADMCTTERATERTTERCWSFDRTLWWFGRTLWSFGRTFGRSVVRSVARFGRSVVRSVVRLVVHLARSVLTYFRQRLFEMS